MPCGLGQSERQALSSTPDHPALTTRLPTAPPPLPACTCSPVPQVMLARWLDYRGQASRQNLLWGFLNARFQTGLRNLLDGAILQTGAPAMFLPAGINLHSIACMPHRWRMGGPPTRRFWPKIAVSKWPEVAGGHAFVPLVQLDQVGKPGSRAWPSLAAGREQGVGGEVDQFACVDELPFDFVRRRLSVVLQARHQLLG